MKNFLSRHGGWFSVCVLSVVLLGAGLPYLSAQREATAQALQQQLAANATALTESRALQQDVAEEAALRQELGEKAYAALFTPPPRADLVAALRQIGLETGLEKFDLTLEPATWLTPAGQSANTAQADLTATALRLNISAPDDRSVFAFTARALDELPGYLKLDRLHMQRVAKGGAVPLTIEASLQFRWLSLNEELLFARQPRP